MLKSVQVTTNFNEEGQCAIVRVQLRYEDMEVLKMPKTCYECPVGYSGHDCGRNVPFLPEDRIKRPATCKLRLVDIKDLI